MRKISKVVLLSDHATSKVGVEFLDALEGCLREQGIEACHLKVRPDVDVADAIYQFDRISLEIKPQLLIVADFACIRMQSAEEEPMYNNMALHLVHLLFKRPWEYDEFMSGRCNFTARYYCVLPEDIAYIKRYYKRLCNPRLFTEGLWDVAAKEVVLAEWISHDYMKQQYEMLPDYMKTIQTYWRTVMEKQPGISEDEGVRRCLQAIQFNCSEQEYLDIMYLMKPVFPMYELEKQKKDACVEPKVRQDVLLEQMQEFLDLDFSISLLG